MDKPIPLSNGSRGIDCYNSKQADNKANLAFDCLNDANDLVKRGGFTSISHGVPFLYPAASTILMYQTPAGAITEYPNRTQPSNGIRYFYFGSVRKFDCVYAPLSGLFSGTPSGIRRMQLEYWNGANWINISYFIDTTFSFVTNTLSGESFTKHGYIAFSRNQIPDWAQVGINGTLGIQNAYWIRAVAINETGALSNWNNILPCRSPGFVVGELPPINALIVANLGGRRMVIIGNDYIQGDQNGAGLSRWNKNLNRPVPLELSFREASGLWGVQTMASWARSSGGTSGGGVNQGTANLVTDHTLNVDLRREQLTGNVVADNLAASSPVGGTQFVLANAPLKKAHGYDHYYVVCTTAGGVAVGEFQEITDYDSTTNTFYFDQRAGFSVAPTGLARFIIVRPPIRCDIFGGRGTPAREIDQPSFGIQPQPVVNAGVVQQRTFPLLQTNYDTSPIGQFPAQGPISFKITKRLRWAVDGGKRWNSVYEPGVKKLFLTNGVSGLLVYDGDTLKSAIADTTSDLARKISGLLADTNTDSNSGVNQSVVAGSALRTFIPNGKYITTFQGSLVMTGDNGRPNDIYHSVPGGGFAIWPYLYTSTIRDPKNNPITGITTFGGNLVCFTRSSIHVGSMVESGQLNLAPIINTDGFESHESVENISISTKAGSVNGLCGPNRTGLAFFDGKNVTYLVDKWSRILKQGINLNQLQNSVATYAPSLGTYICSLASPGSAIQDLLLVYQAKIGAAFIWRYPIGVSSLAVDADSAGNERILIGNNNGMVAILTDSSYDDYNLVSMQFKTTPFQPFGHFEGSYNKVSVTMRGHGQLAAKGQLNVYVNDGDTPKISQLQSFQFNDATFDYTTFSGGATPSRFSDGGMKTAALKLRTGTRGAQVQVELVDSNKIKLRALFLEGKPISDRGYD